MTGVFSADSKPAAEGRRWVVVRVGVVVVSAASESRADRERASETLTLTPTDGSYSHQVNIYSFLIKNWQHRPR